MTNIVGNGVATIVVAPWEGELDPKTLEDALKRKGSRERRVEERVDEPALR